MKNRKLILWIVIPVILAAAAGIILYAVKSHGFTSLKMGTDGATLYRNNGCTLHADKVYIGDDGRAYIDYTATTGDDEILSVGFCNVEINGWAMYYHNFYMDSNADQGSHTGTCVLAEADILERAGITDICDVRFKVSVTIDQSDYTAREIMLTVKDAPAQTAARVPVEGEQVLVDTDEFTFIAQTSGFGTAFGAEQHYVEFYMENKTGKTLYADPQIHSVNDLNTSNFGTVRLTPGAKACLPYGLDTSECARYGISTVDHIDLAFEVSDIDFNRVVEYADYELYFNGFTADSLPEYTRTAEENETVIVDNDRFAFIIFGAERFDDDTYLVRYYIENKTDEAITYSTEQSVINGISVENYTSGYGLSAHRKMYDNMLFMTDASDTNETVEEFRFTLDVTCGEDEVIVSPDQWFEYAQ